MDEPLSNLDAKLRVSMRTEISKLHRQIGATTIYVTHDQVEAMTMADRIVIMKDGVIQQVGKPMELYDHPVNQFVAGFIGSPQMNFFNVTVDKDTVKFNDGSTMTLSEGMMKKLNGRQGEWYSASVARISRWMHRTWSSTKTTPSTQSLQTQRLWVMRTTCISTSAVLRP